MPRTAVEIQRQLGILEDNISLSLEFQQEFKKDTVVHKGKPLFPKIDPLVLKNVSL